MPHVWFSKSVFFGCAALVSIGFSNLAAAETSAVYGANDRLGALNILTPEIVLHSVELVKTGKVYSLAIESKPNKGAGYRNYRAIIQPFSIPGTSKTTGFEDTVTYSPSLGTSMDGLGHAGRDGVHYNGVRAEDIYSLDGGAKIFSIDTLPPMVTRGVLLDIARYRKESVVPAGTAVNQADIEAMMKLQKVTIRRGDVVLLHTGWLDATQEMQAAGGNPGFGKNGALYLAKLGVVAVGGDAGAEVFPVETKGDSAPVHQILLADHGVYILEGVNTKGLAADRAYEFLFIMAAPRLTGTVQATIHPLAVR